MALEAYINGQKTTPSKKRRDTLRFELELVSPTDDSTNEFSYALLVDDALKKKKGLELALDPLEEESDAKLEALARKFEEKYGPKKRKRLVHESDLIDRGYGYDISDSFVDDAELYEDFIPPNVDTQLGGFYVNTGYLGFKQAEDIDPDESDFVLRKKKKPKIKKQPSHCTPQAILANQKLKKAKQHVALHVQKTPKSIPKALFTAAAGSSPLTSKTKPPPAKRPKKEAHKQEGTSSLFAGSSPLTPSTSGSILDSTTPSVQIGIGGISVNIPIFSSPQKMNGTTEAGQTGLGGQKPSISSDSSSQLGPVVEGVKEAKPPPVLPDNLPADLLAKIRQLEGSVARDQAPDGKVSNKVRGSYDKQLVDIEIACKTVSLKTRMAVMSYLSSRLGVSRATMFKRVKQKLWKQEAEALEEPLRKLQEAVNASMPEQAALYEEEIIRAKAESTSFSEKSLQLEMEDESKPHLDDVFEDSQQPGSSQQEGSKPKRLPRKKYKWAEETKQLLYAVVRVKVGTEETINRISRGNGEEIISTFLDERVKPFWPKGWMQKSVLYKISEPVHKHFTSPQPKKAVAGKKPEKEKLTVKKEPASKPAVPVLPSVPIATITLPSTRTVVTTSSQVAKAGLQLPAAVPKTVKTLSALPRSTVVNKTVSVKPTQATVTMKAPQHGVAKMGLASAKPVAPMKTALEIASIQRQIQPASQKIHQPRTEAKTSTSTSASTTPTLFLTSALLPQMLQAQISNLGLTQPAVTTQSISLTQPSLVIPATAPQVTKAHVQLVQNATQTKTISVLSTKTPISGIQAAPVAQFSKPSITPMQVQVPSTKLVTSTFPQIPTKPSTAALLTGRTFSPSFPSPSQLPVPRTTVSAKTWILQASSPTSQQSVPKPVAQISPRVPPFTAVKPTSAGISATVSLPSISQSSPTPPATPRSPVQQIFMEHSYGGWKTPQTPSTQAASAASTLNEMNECSHALLMLATQNATGATSAVTQSRTLSIVPHAQSVIVTTTPPAAPSNSRVPKMPPQ